MRAKEHLRIARLRAQKPGNNVRPKVEKVLRFVARGEQCTLKEVGTSLGELELLVGKEMNVRKYLSRHVKKYRKKKK